MVDIPARLIAIDEELAKANAEYISAKSAFDSVRVRFEVAREKLAATKGLASEMMSSRDWSQWGADHPSVRYAGTAIGEAIIHFLYDHAYERALNCARDQVSSYVPYASLSTIAEALESGGFEFQSVTPNREVNAALINLAGVKKTKLKTYAHKEADFIMELAQTEVEQEEAQ